MKTITLDDINNKSIDDIIELYKNGYTLESNTSQTLQYNGYIYKANIDTLQISPITQLGLVFSAGLAIGAIVVLYYKK